MSAETLEAWKKQRYQEREITCEDCGVVFVAGGRPRYCPVCWKKRRTAAAHKCHAVKNDWDLVFKMIAASCAGPPKEDCAYCPILGCSKRGADYKMEPKYASRRC